MHLHLLAFTGTYDRRLAANNCQRHTEIILHILQGTRVKSTQKQQQNVLQLSVQRNHTCRQAASPARGNLR